MIWSNGCFDLGPLFVIPAQAGIYTTGWLGPRLHGGDEKLSSPVVINPFGQQTIDVIRSDIAVIKDQGHVIDADDHCLTSAPMGHIEVIA